MARPSQHRGSVYAKKRLIKAIVDRFRSGKITFYKDFPEIGANMFGTDFGPGMEGITFVVERDGEVLCLKYWDDRLAPVDVQWVVMRTGKPCVLVNGWPVSSVQQTRLRVIEGPCPWCNAEVFLKCAIVDSQEIWYLDCPDRHCGWTKRCDETGVVME